MKYTIKIIFILLALVNCTSEEKETLYNALIRNASDNTIKIKGYNSKLNQLKYEINIESMRSGGEVDYFSPSFGGYVSGADSMVFSFNNGKGYICVVRTAESVGDVNQLCFQDKSPFDIEGFKNLGNNTFEFEITQEDYDNAYDLPE